MDCRQDQTLEIAHVLKLVEDLPEADKMLLYHNLIHTSHEVVLWFDAYGSLHYISENCARILGYSNTELVENPETLLKIIHPQDLSLWRNHHSTIHHDEFQIRIMHEGRARPFIYRSIPLLDNKGNLCGCLGSLSDVDLRRAEYGDAAVLALAAEKTHLGVVITDQQGVIRYANPAFYSSAVCHQSSCMGDICPILTDASRRDYPEMWQALDAHSAWQGRLKFTHEECVAHWMNINVSAVLDENADVLRYVAVLEDVTAHLVEEQRRREQNEELQHLLNKLEEVKQEWECSFDSIDQVIAIIDDQSRVRRINKAVTTLYGHDSRKIIKCPLSDVLPPDMARAVMQTQTGEYYDPRLDKWFNWRCLPYTYGEHRLNWHILTLHDVTELRRITAELSEAYALHKKAQSHLVQQEKMASIGQLAAGVAHEINNPVGFVASNLNTLNKYVKRLCKHITTLEDGIASGEGAGLQDMVAQSRKDNRVSIVEEDARELIEESLDGTERVKNIVSNLKSFSRVGGSGKQWTDLHECIESSINIAWNEIKYHAQVERDFGDLPQIYCSAQQMNQVFLNLLVNAAHAIKNQGIISVSTFVDKSWAVVRITDTGCGIAPEYLESIFDPFFTTKEAGKGTGLGLSLCYDMVQKHAGEIKVRSTVGKGSTFEIRLPLQAPEEHETENDIPANSEE